MEDKIKQGTIFAGYAIALMIFFRVVLNDMLEIISGVTLVYLILSPIIALLIMKRFHDLEVSFKEYLIQPIYFFIMYLVGGYFSGFLNLDITIPQIWETGSIGFSVITLVTLFVGSIIYFKVFRDKIIN
jgi:hypothetical protein